MSIYKGGYIFQDISGTMLTTTPQDLLSKDLKEYLRKYADEVDDKWNKEVLNKPLELIVKDSQENLTRVKLNRISDDLTSLLTSYTIGKIIVDIVIDTSLFVSCFETILS